MGIRTHGHHPRGRPTRTYSAWHHMRQRCTNPNVEKYADYGGRGITHCSEWADFSAFLRDMGECPPGMSLDRINNDLGYAKENCRWATWTQQQQNTRQNRKITFAGETLCIAEWARRLGVKADTLYMRLHRGWALDRVLAQKVGSGRNLSRT